MQVCDGSLTSSEMESFSISTHLWHSSYEPPCEREGTYMINQWKGLYFLSYQCPSLNDWPTPVKTWEPHCSYACLTQYQDIEPFVIQEPKESWDVCLLTTIEGKAFLNKFDYVSFSHFWTCSFFKLGMFSLFCLFTVIGGKDVYLRLSMSEQCDKKDSVWETLQKEVLWHKGYLSFYFM